MYHSQRSKEQKGGGGGVECVRKTNHHGLLDVIRCGDGEVGNAA